MAEPGRSEEGRYLPPWLLQLLGVALLIGSAVFWVITGRENLALMGAAMTLIGIGAYRGVTATLRREIAPPPDRKEREP